MELIDKAAVVAEIEKFKENANKRGAIGKVSTTVLCNELLSFLDTIEVKEVQEEPVSEELEEAADKGCNSQGETYHFEYVSNIGVSLYETYHLNNPIDAAFEMICWLLKNKKI